MNFSNLENFLSMFTDGKGQIDGVAIKKAYIGRGGVAKEFKKGYIEENGVAKLFFKGGVDVSAMAISYSGKHTDQVVTMGDGKQYRLLTLTSTGTLTLEEAVNAEVWLCNGGSNGETAYYDSSTYHAGGHGGGGGKFGQGNSIFAEAIVTVASGGGTSKFAPTGGTAISASIAGGGSGKGGKSSSYGYGAGGAKAGDRTIPFKDSYFTKYPCAGGGGGRKWSSGSGVNGGNGGWSEAAGAAGTYSTGGAGGTTGGGAGGDDGKNGGNASYYGSGGGGGGAELNSTLSDVFGTGGKGYQGVCYIRIPIEQPEQ